MNKILIFGGTSEGRIIAETLSKNKIPVHISVATDYGRMVLQENEFLKILKGRLDLNAMKELCKKNNYALIIDATHPFATEVSENIKKCAAEFSPEEKIPLIRFERNVELKENKNLIYADSVAECKELLLKFSAAEGNILLTTGSKNLKDFCENPDLRKKLIVRVLPGIESMNLCYENKLEGRQIIAMQGPFSVQMNKVQIEDYSISVLVTKESGSAGGTDSKIQAALEKGIKCIVIKNPDKKNSSVFVYKNYFKFSSISDIYKCIEKKYDISISASEKINVDLIGIGMGSEKSMTVEAAEKIKNADLIFGAERLLKEIKSTAKKYPYYLAKDIIPVLQSSIESDSEVKNAVILFSGDTGFFSGAKKAKAELEKIKKININILSGISSVSYLSAKTGITYDDAKIVSLHGTDEKIWNRQLQDGLSNYKKIFILTSGIKDLHKAAELVMEYNKSSRSSFNFAIGFQLSYENEMVKILTPEQCLSLTEEGLYSAFIFED